MTSSTTTPRLIVANLADGASIPGESTGEATVAGNGPGPIEMDRRDLAAGSGPTVTALAGRTGKTGRSSLAHEPAAVVRPAMKHRALAVARLGAVMSAGPRAAGTATVETAPAGTA